jgi:hypothetical protein
MSEVECVLRGVVPVDALDALLLRYFPHQSISASMGTHTPCPHHHFTSTHPRIRLEQAFDVTTLGHAHTLAQEEDSASDLFAWGADVDCFAVCMHLGVFGLAT